MKPYGLSSNYEYKRSDFRSPRTQREAGIDHLEWDRPTPWRIITCLVVPAELIAVATLIYWVIQQ